MTGKSGGGAGIWAAGIVLALVLFGAVINHDKGLPELTPAQQAAEAARREAKREAEARRELAAIERTERRDTVPKRPSLTARPSAEVGSPALTRPATMHP